MIRALPRRFSLLCGDDPLFLPALSIGGVGLVSVVANLIPRSMRRIWDAWQSGKREQAQALFHRAYPLTQAIFFETNPIPVKWGLAHLGYIQNELRLPLVPMSEGGAKKFLPILTEVMPAEKENG